MLLFQPAIAAHYDLHVSANCNWFFKILRFWFLVVVSPSNPLLKWFVKVEIVCGKLFLDFMRVDFLEIVIASLAHDLYV
jgi:hypothetical protein